MKESAETGGNIPTNLRLLLVAEEIVRAPGPVTPTEVNQTLGLPKPTIHRLFATLEEGGFIRRDIDGRRYTPGRRLRRMAAGVLSGERLRAARFAILTRLAREIGETCNIAAPDRDAMLYIDRVETAWPLRIQLQVGARVPLYCTASGKMFLSTLSDRHLRGYLASSKRAARTRRSLIEADALMAELMLIRRRGHALDNEEFMEGMVAAAVPVKDKEGRLMSTLSFHAPVQRVAFTEVETHLSLLHAAARELAELVS
ncbi:IclR family transcriptional regulator [Pikeienuella piscinae]|uniref:IclR family transcriptional regulator n=1 Tax=Pikeienuella piscinae TaxID=2748098 RepID=A0A7L5BTR9_9RHOB|nr:IclR family transcriptional regulator [Pikeienuella piscinae]QIE54223.1 IclR family transcriptional regulator [Pikeienuella piscinae]